MVRGRESALDRTLRFVGDEVAAVAGEPEEIARDALRLIQVEYKLLPFVMEMAAAIEAGAPQVHATTWCERRTYGPAQ